MSTLDDGSFAHHPEHPLPSTPAVLPSIPQRLRLILSTVEGELEGLCEFYVLEPGEEHLMTIGRAPPASGGLALVLCHEAVSRHHATVFSQLVFEDLPIDSADPGSTERAGANGWYEYFVADAGSLHGSFILSSQDRYEASAFQRLSPARTASLPRKLWHGDLLKINSTIFAAHFAKEGYEPYMCVFCDRVFQLPTPSDEAAKVWQSQEPIEYDGHPSQPEKEMTERMADIPEADRKRILELERLQGLRENKRRVLRKGHDSVAHQESEQHLDLSELGPQERHGDPDDIFEISDGEQEDDLDFRGSSTRTYYQLVRHLAQHSRGRDLPTSTPSPITTRPSPQISANSADRHIEESNKGYQMLQKLGWKHGSGLGRDASGTKEPIRVEERKKRTGLGLPDPVDQARDS